MMNTNLNYDINIYTIYGTYLHKSKYVIISIIFHLMHVLYFDGLKDQKNNESNISHYNIIL